MADTVYVDGVTLLTADTMNDLNRLHYTILSDPATLPALFARINALTEDTSPDSANDFLVTYDASAATGKKVKPSNLSSGLVKIGATQTASNSTSIDFTSGIDATYNEYLVTITNAVPATTGTDFQMQVSEAAVFQTGSTYSQGGSSGAAVFKLSAGSGVDNTAALGGVCGEVRFFNPASTALKKLALFSPLGHVDSAGGYVALAVANTVGSFVANNTAIDGFRFKFSSGNIASGVFTLYGITK